MTRPTLHVVEGGGKPEPDEVLVQSRKEAVSLIETAGSFWLLAEDGESYQVLSHGNALLLTARVEELARARKMKAIGLLGEE